MNAILTVLLIITVSAVVGIGYGICGEPPVGHGDCKGDKEDKEDL